MSLLSTWAIGVSLPLFNALFSLQFTEGSIANWVALSACLYISQRCQWSANPLSLPRGMALIAIGLLSGVGFATQQITLLAIASMAWVWTWFQAGKSDNNSYQNRVRSQV